jgi:hypothetical protein
MDLIVYSLQSCPLGNAQQKAPLGAMPRLEPALQRHNTKNVKQPVSDLYIPIISLPILLHENMWTYPGNI